MLGPRGYGQAFVGLASLRAPAASFRPSPDPARKKPSSPGTLPADLCFLNLDKTKEPGCHCFIQVCVFTLSGRE